MADESGSNRRSGELIPALAVLGAGIGAAIGAATDNLGTGIWIGGAIGVGPRHAGILDWSEARQGDALYDLATLTLAHEEHLEDVIAGYGVDVDRDLIRAWWSWRSLVGVRWLFENGYGSPDQFPEVAVLRSQT